MTKAYMYKVADTTCANEDKCEPDPGIYSRGRVRICFWVITIQVNDCDSIWLDISSGSCQNDT